MPYQKLYRNNNPLKPVEISTETGMNSILSDTSNVGRVYKYTGTTTATYTNGDLYQAANAATNEQGDD